MNFKLGQCFPPAGVGGADAMLALARSQGRRDASPTLSATMIQGFKARNVSENSLPGDSFGGE